MNVSLSDFLLSDMGLGVSQRFPGQSSCGTGGGTLSSGGEIAARPCFNVAPFCKHSSFFIENVSKKAHETRNALEFVRNKSHARGAMKQGMATHSHSGAVE